MFYLNESITAAVPISVNLIVKQPGLAAAAQFVGTAFCAPEGYRFDSQSGHMTGCRSHPRPGFVWKATNINVSLKKEHNVEGCISSGHSWSCQVAYLDAQNEDYTQNE